MQSLDDVLNGNEATEPEATDEVTEEPQGEEQELSLETENDDGEVAQVEPPATEKPAEEPWTKAAYLDEKRKRQELERRLEAQAKEKPKAPDIFENQDDYTGYVESKINSAVGNTRAEMSEFFARKEYGSAVVDEKMAKFEEMTAANPSLLAEVGNSPAPWHAMIEKVNAAEKLAELQDLPAYENKVRAEIEAKVRAELQGNKKAGAEKLSGIMPSLAGKRSSGSEKTPIDQSLEDILGR